MATINGSVSKNSDAYSFYISWSESKESDYISTNKTKVTATAYIKCTDHTAWANGLSQTLIIDGTKFTDSVDVSLSEGKTVKLITGSKTITHNTDGSKKITISADCDLPDGNGYGPVWGEASATVTLTKIPRYATSVQSLKSKTETSITMNWSSDSTIDYIWYSKDNGSNWTGINVTDGKSGSYSISSLSANTTYKIKTRVRRKDSQLTTDSSTLSVTTYNYPYVKSVDTTNLTIGNSQKLTLYNPLSRTVTVRMNKDKASGTQLYSGSTSGTSITFIPEDDTLYETIPSATSGKCVYSVIYSSSTKSTTGSYTYKVKGTETPTFSNYTYADSKDESVELTGDPQIIINGYNKLTVTIPVSDKAIANNKATMSKYRLVCGNQSTEENYSETDDVVLSLNNITNITFMVYAIDSRGLSTPIINSISEENWKNYSNITITSASVGRVGDVGTDTILTFEGSIWNNTFGNQANEIVSCQYKYKKTNESEYSDLIDITPTREEDMFTFNSTIKGDLEANGFNASNSFNIQIIVTDKISSATYNVLLGAGTPVMAIHPNGVAFGAQYDEDEGGVLQVIGKSLYDALFYKAGDTFKPFDVACLGHLTSSATQIIFNITTDKRLDDISTITIKKMLVDVRHADGGYVLNDVDLAGSSVSAAKKTNNSIRVVYNTGSNFTNNCPVSVDIRSSVIEFS